MKVECPRCGANVTFMPSTQKCYCEYCGSTLDISEFDVSELDKVDKHEYDEYTCTSCGAKLLMDEETTITDCVYCGSIQIAKQKFQGEFRPEAVIPFKIDKEKFISMYKNFIHKKRFAPNEFKNNSKISDIKGMYLPFQLYTFETDTTARGQAIRRTKDNTYYKYFETEFSMELRSPQDASLKFDDNIMTTLEPFGFYDLKPFNPAYLNGFMAENGNEDNNDLEKKAEQRSTQAIKQYLHGRLNGYTFTGGQIYTKFRKLKQQYVLLPVWFFNTKYKDKMYAYALNGQTGKIVGEIPLSKPKFWSFMITLIILAFMFTASLLTSDVEDSGELIGVIWVGVIATYLAIKARYKNVRNVLDNPIERLETKERKFEEYSKRNYDNLYGARDYARETIRNERV